MNPIFRFGVAAASWKIFRLNHETPEPYERTYFVPGLPVFTPDLV